MPYVSQQTRKDVERRGPRTPGELNYALTQFVISYLNNLTLYNGEISYTDLADVISALEGAKLEFYRRVVVPYEERKMKDNGDVYGINSK
jgi:hypothetical protein